MICILIRDLTLRAEVIQLLNDAGLSHCAHDPDSDESISALYGNDIQAAIVEQFIPQIADAAWRDLLGSMGTRIPLFVITASDRPKHLLSLRNDSSISWLKDPTAHQIVTMFTNIFASHAIGAGENDRIIADYTSFVPIEKLRTDKAVSMLKIDGSDFRTISIEFGSEAFISLQNCFQKIIASLWGKRGSLRASDTIVRKTTSPCTYYVFLEKSRVAQAVPAPGVLEMIADRISLQIQEALCLELLKNRSDRILPHCITKIPTFSIGYATILANPSIEFNGAIEQIFDRASESAKIHRHRVLARETELMQTIIQSDEILVPNFQAVFHLKPLTKDLLNEAEANKSISAMLPMLYGFESLIRPQLHLIDQKISKSHLVHVNPLAFRPEMLFALAKHCHLALELDQACLQLATIHGAQLPGKLFLNILPRNLMRLDRLHEIIDFRENLVFEISESESISNPEQMLQMHEFILGLGASLAADDFGKGQGNIERVIKFRPEIIKIDRALVENIHIDPVKRIFVAGIVQSAKMINAQVLAEGIELWEEALVAQELGIDLVQGFLFHRPQSAKDIQTQLSSAPLVINAA